MITFSKTLTKGTLIKRYKRFFADVRLASGEVVVSHCPNTGSMATCGSPGDTVYLLHSDDPKRKLKYTWEYTKTNGGYIVVNTQRPNRIVEQALRDGQLQEFAHYSELIREPKIQEGTKLDFLLKSTEDPDCYIEVKNVTLYKNDRLLFPDAVTTRGQKHLKTLMNLAQEGYRAVMLYVVSRPEGQKFEPAKDIDPVYAELLAQAREAGVEVFCYRVDGSLKGLRLGGKVDHDFC